MEKLGWTGEHTHLMGRALFHKDSITLMDGPHKQEEAAQLMPVKCACM